MFFILYLVRYCVGEGGASLLTLTQNSAGHQVQGGHTPLHHGGHECGHGVRWEKWLEISGWYVLLCVMFHWYTRYKDKDINKN